MSKKLLLVLLAISLLLVGCNAYEFYPDYQETQNIDEFFEQYRIKVLQMDPEMATYMGEFEGHEASRNDDELTDRSHEFAEHKMEFYKESLKILKSFDDASLSHQQRLNRDVLAWHLNLEIEGESFMLHEYQFYYPFSSAQYHQIHSVEDAENYICRIEAVPLQLEQLSGRIGKQVEQGIIPPAITFLTYLRQFAESIRIEPGEDSLFTTFVTSLEGSEIPDDVKTQLEDKALIAIGSHVLPAYKEFHESLLSLKDEVVAASAALGVWDLPQGDEYYAHAIRMQTTTDLTPQEIHDLGLQEVERIQDEIRERLIDLGFEDPDPIQTLVDLGEQDLVRDKDEILAECRRVVEETYELLPDLFNTLPRAEVIVEPGSLDSYQRPSRDGQRPGVFYVTADRPHAKKDIEHLVFHETIPGHHLQLALQMESDLPIFREFTENAAYKEGWALYAERLMYENGLYSDVWSELGYLQSELFRAARLVIDTGIHYKQWDRQYATDQLYELCGVYSESEIARYAEWWPGQALAYKIGELKMLELREMAMEQLGNDFDLKEFHDVVLSMGSVPLEILEQEVLRYIEEKQN